jgi:alpha-L-rhamnosidase
MTPTAVPRRWMGHYVWAANGPTDGDRVALFRRSFDLDVAPMSAVLWHLDADSRFVAYVNGVEVARGPVRAQPRRRRYLSVDVSMFLTAGSNTLAVAVRHYGCAIAWYQPANPANATLVADLELPGSTIGTDASWKALTSEAWIPQRPKGIGSTIAESIDGRLLDPLWNRGDFDDDSWSNATVISAMHVGTKGRTRPPVEPYGALRPPATPPAHVTRHKIEVGTFTAEPGGRWSTIIDLGVVRIGVWELEVEAPEGSIVELSIAEDMRADGQLGSPRPNLRLRYIARGHDDVVTTFDRHGGRFLRIEISASDTSKGSPPTLRSLACVEHLRPRPEGAYFRCSDERLNRIFEIGLRTVDACALDVYVDCPTREQRAWTGDFVVHQMVDFTTNPDRSMATFQPWLTASPRHDGMLPMAVAGDIEANDLAYIPDWPLHWIRSVHNVMRWAGDTGLVDELLPMVDTVLRWFVPFLAEDGLLRDVPGWTLVDWATVPTVGASASLNALWARGLSDAVDLARWRGDLGRATFYQRLLDDLRGAFEAFWDEGRGVYRERLDSPGEATSDGTDRVVTQHANATAVVARLVPEQRVRSVMTIITDRSRLVRHSAVMGDGADGIDHGPGLLFAPYPPPSWDVERQILAAEPFYRSIIHDALGVAGMANEIADALLDWSPWVEAGETTWPETWHGGTHCHGWSATPTSDLITMVAGVTPAEPGFARAHINPQLGHLDWLAARVPVGDGWLHVHATHDTVTVDSPVPWSTPS